MSKIATQKKVLFILSFPGKHLKLINKRLLSIRPPHCVTRLPRRVDERLQWKASEWKHWLLYYALPCLEGLLPQDNWRHLAKLSEAVHILLHEEVSTRDIDHAGNLQVVKKKRL